MIRLPAGAPCDVCVAAREEPWKIIDENEHTLTGINPRRSHRWLTRVQMNLSDLEASALRLNDLYEQLEIKRHGRVWTTQELALGFMGDVGDLAKLIQANAGVRHIEDCKEKLGHELSDCLWSILVLANKCNIDLEAEFVKNTKALTDYVSGELNS